ncbi:hypothetical protein LNP26_28810 [Klebsiella variicola subsp. variicola]|nr:hypothetical protein [Klebsiella variicola subsp. variicola]
MTPCEFEFAFPCWPGNLSLCWECAAAGTKAELISFARTPPGKVAVAALVFIALILAFVAQNHTR